MWRQPWLLFGIGVLLTTVIMATFAASALVRVQRQHQILRELERLGAGYEYKEYHENSWHIPFAWQYPREVTIEVDANACDLHAVLKLANQLVEVRWLEIRHAHVLPQLPVARIASLTKLEGLDLPGAKITPDDLALLENLTKLVWLDIREAPLSYEQVAAWAKAHSQTRIAWQPALTKDQLQLVDQLENRGTLAFTIDGETSLRPINEWGFFMHELSSRDWPELHNLRPMRTATLQGEEYGDGDLHQLASFPQLTHITLYNTSITPTGLAALKKLPELEEISIRGSDVGPSAVLQLREQRPELRIYLEQRKGPRLDRPNRSFYSRYRRSDPPLHAFLGIYEL